MLGGYRRDLAAIRAQLTTLAQLAADAGEVALAERATEAAGRIAPRPFRVAFVGEFKAGKSTLINALVGREVLAVATRECTTVITRVRAALGGDGHAIGRHASGEERPLSLEAAREAVQRREQEDDPLVEVELALPDLGWLDGDVELVDTPGTGAVGRVRERVTLGWLPNADAVVFVTRADQLLNTSEMAFLKEGVLSLDPAGLFVVINRMDMVATARDRAALEARAVERLASVGEPTVLWTSAADAMDAAEAIREVYGEDAPDPDDVADWEASGVPQLRDALRTYLARDRVQAELERHRRQLASVAAALEARLVQRIKVVDLDAASAERERARATQLEAALRRVGVELQSEVTAAFGTTCRSRLREVVRDSSAEARRLLRTHASDPRAAGRALESLGTRALARLQTVLAREWKQIRDQTSARLVELEGSALRDLQHGKVRSAFGGIDLARALQTRQQSREVVERHAVQNGSAEGAASLAALGTMIGYAVAGPVGGLIGAWASLSVVAQPTFQEVRRQVEERVVDPERTVDAFALRLQQAGDQARELAEQTTLKAVDEAIGLRLSALGQRSPSKAPTASLDQQTLRATVDAVRALSADAR